MSVESIQAIRLAIAQIVSDTHGGEDLDHAEMWKTAHFLEGFVLRGADAMRAEYGPKAAEPTLLKVVK